MADEGVRGRENTTAHQSQALAHLLSDGVEECGYCTVSNEME